MVMPFSRTFEWDDAGWREGAACRDADPNLFFPMGTTGVAVDEIESAKAVCRSCPVRKRCLEFALVTNQEAGVWGGTSEEERRKLRKEWSAARRRRQLVSQ
jgi:WhiB family transcriptional regulator, redox-sensing transcriptional regulator